LSRFLYLESARTSAPERNAPSWARTSTEIVCKTVKHFFNNYLRASTLLNVYVVGFLVKVGVSPETT